MRIVAQGTFVLVVLLGVVAYGSYRLDPLKRTSAGLETLSGISFDELNESGTLVSGGADTVVVFSNFECVWCDVFWRVIDSLRVSGDAPTVRLRHHVSQADTSALVAAAAFECAAVNGRGHSVGTMLFDRARDSSTITTPMLAVESGIPDTSEFKSCLQRPEWASLAQRDSAMALRAGVSGTPTIFTRRYKVKGAISTTELRELVIRSRRTK
jgi:protein-disulfide isomerase